MEAPPKANQSVALVLCTSTTFILGSTEYMIGYPVPAVCNVPGIFQNCTAQPGTKQQQQKSASAYRGAESAQLSAPAVE